jgi:hypothetical protein
MMGVDLRGVKGLVLLPCLAFGLADCKSDDEARLQGPAGGTPLAVGAYEPLRFGDACAGGGKINFCSSETVVSVDQLTSEDPAIARIVLAADVPATFFNATHFVQGVAPGFAMLHFRGTFDDGSVRSADLQVEVRRVDRTVLASHCGTDDETAEVLTLPSGSGSFDVKLFGRAVELAGWHPNAIEPLAGVEPIGSSYGRNAFLWTAPAEPVVIDVRSGILAAKVGILRAYGPADVTDIVVSSPNGDSLTGQPGDRARIGATTKVRGHAPCDVPTVVFKTETPTVCSGPDGAETWRADNEYGGFLTLNAEGSCRVSASADGARFFRAATFRFFVVEPPGEERFDGFNEPCAVEGSTSCTYGETSQVTLCREGRWVSKEMCGPTRTCDARDPSLGGCVGGGPCSECRALR